MITAIIEKHFNAGERAAVLKEFLNLPEWEGQDFEEFTSRKVNGVELTASEQYHLTLNISGCIYNSNDGNANAMERDYSWIEYAFAKFGLENPKP